MAKNPSGKGGGRRKVFYTALCLQGIHGIRGHKSAGSHYFVRTGPPKNYKAKYGKGCPMCTFEGSK